MRNGKVRSDRFCKIALFLATISVGLFCLADPVVAQAGAASAQSEAEQLIDRDHVRRGLCLVLGHDGDVAVELVRSSQLLVYVRVPEPAAVAALRKQADAAGYGIDRLVVEQGPVNKLPHADNMVDVVIAAETSSDELSALSLDEILRVLRPEGTAIIGGGLADQPADRGIGKLKQWVEESNATELKAWTNSTGAWVQFSKPSQAGTGDWSHWEHGPDNNPVSTDTLIKAPYMTQFLATPYYIGMPSITTAAGGRTFLAIGHIAHHRREWNMLHKLIARNGFNGTVLWERELPEGYLVHRSAFIATKETFFMIDGDRCLLLDPQTGDQQGQIRIPGLTGEWKWMVLQDGVLFALAGKKEPGAEITKGDRTFGGWSWADLSKGYYRKPGLPWGYGNTLAAFDLKEKRILWTHTEEQPIDSRAMSMGKEKLVLYCPGAHLRCLDTNSGEIRWTNHDAEVLSLIEEPGKGLRSTPGFRTACQAVFTPDAVIIQGQTRMNVVAISTVDGYLLWTKKKFTNNPNALFVDGKVVLGVGPGGSHVALDPLTGNVLEDLKFTKRACTRLTASSDSFFCRGEGTLRFDRSTGKVLVDGSARPACNDGALPANSLLYLGPWQCDCNLSLIGNVAKCSAGDFRFDHVATEAERLELSEGDIHNVVPLETTSKDWPRYRHDIHRSAGTTARVAEAIMQRWQFTPPQDYLPSEPTAASGLIFISGNDGKVRALNSQTGSLTWEFSTAGQIKMPPTISEDRAYIGSGDGYVYCLEAATGRLLWRFRAAPVERHIMVYGELSSTWPVNTGVLVQDGVAYFAAGIIDYDGTYVYALDAKTGKIKWQNNSSGHLNPELRKGISAQGNMTIQGDRLLLAGGNQISPAPFDLKTGKCLAEPRSQGHPQAKNGKYVGVFRDKYTIVGGRILFSSPQNVSTSNRFVVFTGGKELQVNYGGIPPAWDEDTLALVNYRFGKLSCFNADSALARLDKEGSTEAPKGRSRGHTLADSLEADGGLLWQSDLDQSNKFAVISLAVCPNAIVAVVQYQRKFRAQPEWHVVAFHKQDGKRFWRQRIEDEPLLGGLLVDREGQVVVTMLNGNVLCLGLKDNTE